MPVLGLITNNQHNVFQRNVITGVRAAAAEHGYDVLINSYAENATNPQPITLDYHAVDGVLVIASAAPPALLHDIYAADIPLTLISHQVPDLPVPAVIADNQQGIAELVRHLVTACQRERLVFIRGLLDQRDNREREMTFTQELMRYNLTVPPEWMLRGDFDADVATQSLSDLIAHDTDFDALVASDYLMGIAAVETLRAAGFAVPEDVAVVAFGDGPEAEAAGLTTVAADIVDQGQRAARQLISQIEGLRISGMTILSVRLIVRETSVLPDMDA